MPKSDNLTTILCRCHEIWEPKLPGTLWAPRACNGTALPLPLHTRSMIFTLIKMIVSRFVGTVGYLIRFSNSPSPWCCGPTRAMASSFLMFLDYTQRRVSR